MRSLEIFWVGLAMSYEKNYFAASYNQLETLLNEFKKLEKIEIEVQVDDDFELNVNKIENIGWLTMKNKLESSLI